MSKQPTPSQVQWMEEHADDTLVPNVIACCITSGVLSAGIVLLRVCSRQLLRRQQVLEANDYLFIAGWVLYILYLIAFACTTRYGEGRHSLFVTDAKVLQIIGIVAEVAYYPSMSLIKFSLLQLYSKIFPQQGFYCIVWGVSVFVAAWGILGSIVAILQCMPIRYAWDDSIKHGYCINFGAFVLISGIINILTDFIILLMPIPLVLNLNISKQKKCLVIFTFAIGSSACIVSIVRLGFSLGVASTWDASWANVTSGFVISTELLVALLAASIPTYRPIWRYFRNSSTAEGRKNEINNRAYLPATVLRNQAKVSHGGSSIVAHQEGRIYVTDSVELTRQTRQNGAWVTVEDGESSCPSH